MNPELFTRPEDEPTIRRCKELARCANRELDKRKGFYPRWVREKRMTQTDADYETAAMKELMFVLRWLAANPKALAHVPIGCTWDGLGCNPLDWEPPD